MGIRRPVSAKARFPSKPSPCWICVAESDKVTCLSPGTSVFPYQYHSIGAPYSNLICLPSTWCNLTSRQSPYIKHTYILGIIGQTNEFSNWDEHLIQRRLITYCIIFENCKMFLRQFFLSLRVKHRAWEIVLDFSVLTITKEPLKPKWNLIWRYTVNISAYFVREFLEVIS